MPHEARWIWSSEAILHANVRRRYVGDVSGSWVCSGSAGGFVGGFSVVVAVVVRWVTDIKRAEWYMLDGVVNVKLVSEGSVKRTVSPAHGERHFCPPVMTLVAVQSTRKGGTSAVLPQSVCQKSGLYIHFQRPRISDTYHTLCSQALLQHFGYS